MSSTLTPNMSLTKPGVGTESSPTWASELNSDMDVIDQHNHTPGSGVLITPAAIDINSALTFANNQATNVAGMTLVSQTTTAPNGTLYQAGVNLHFIDGDGNDIPITVNGAVGGSPGSISNLTAPASASYSSISKTFVWQSDSGSSIAANLDCASVLLRNISPNSTNAITLQAPSALPFNYNVVLPILPASQKFMTIDSSGNMAAPWAVDSSTITVASNTIAVPAGGITATQLATDAVTTVKIQDGAVTGPKKAALGQQLSTGVTSYGVPASLTAVPGLSVAITTTGRPVMIMLVSSGGLVSDLSVVTGTLTMILFRGATQVAGQQVAGNSGVSVTVPSSSFMHVDTPAAGTYTYSLSAQYSTLSSGNAAIESCKLLAYEL